MKVKILAALLSAATVSMSAEALNDRAIQATSPAKVNAIRTSLVEYIWGAPWTTVLAKQPVAVQHRYTPVANDAIPTQVNNLESLDRLDVSTSEQPQAGSEEAVASSAFVYHPAKPNLHRAVIVHQGHGCELTDTGDRGVHIEVAIRDLVAAGYTVAAMRMPLFQRLSDCGHTTKTHGQFFDVPLKAGSPLKFFLEPIVRTMNYLNNPAMGLTEIDMIGLSGGGWTTTVYSALDTRIQKSFPVAGTLPLYLRAEHYNHDLEQYLPAFYQLAGYKDLYVLGASGKGREQIQILNRFDDCCFGEKQHKVTPPLYIEAVHEYEQEVAKTLKKMNGGQFAVYVDESARYHQVPTAAIERIILPVLGGGELPLRSANAQSANE